MQPLSDGITIMTVAIRRHYRYVPLQLRIIEAMNPGQDFKFLVVDNRSADASQLVVDDPRCEVMAGVERGTVGAHGAGSYHHAAALNAALKRVKTRYALVIDPDLFAIYRNWITECIDHMRRQDLTFFGVPWHYSRPNKWRYFPCVHFLLMDLHKIDPDAVDFTPALHEDRQQMNSKSSVWLRRNAPFIYAHMLVESRRDTGWKLRRDFGRSRRSDVVQPVIDMDQAFQNPKYLRTTVGRWVEQHLPRRWSLYPAAGSYVTPARAPAFDWEELRSLEPEAFVWRGAPEDDSNASLLHLTLGNRPGTHGRTVIRACES